MVSIITKQLKNKFDLELLQREFNLLYKTQNKTPKVYLKSPSHNDNQEDQDVLEKESSHTRKDLKSKQFKQDPLGMSIKQAFN